MTTITNYSQGFFVGPVTAEFGWQPAEFFLGFTLMMCLGVVTAPIVGALVPKFGIRKLDMAWGGYDRPLLIFIALLVLSIVLFLSLGKYPEEGRREMASG